MDRLEDTTCMDGLRFFGKISASISHEMKNALAVISESAGLVEDLLGAAERGMPLNEANLKKSMTRIRNHVKRADDIIKNMNAFAHSIDEPFSLIDVGKVIELTAALTKRLLDMQCLTLETKIPTDPVMIETAPFFLKNLAWLLLQFAMDHAGGSTTLCVEVERIGGQIEIRLSGMNGLEKTPSPEEFPTTAMQSLLNLLGAELESDAAGGRLVLKLLKRPGAG
ncbi:MAG: histidine kinase [Planctomycetota bacterium]